MAKTDLQNVADDLYLIVKKGIQLFDEFWGWLYLPICLSICISADFAAGNGDLA